MSTFFDRFADSFDSTLQRLDYAAPQLLYEALVERVACGRGGLVLLDAGCGTGLCGVLLRSTAKFLAGVDLSVQMLARRRARHLYDELLEAELCAFMASRPEEFDRVICADTLVCFGALNESVTAARRGARPKGVFALPVEALPEETSTSFRINAHGRYAHARGITARRHGIVGVLRRAVQVRCLAQGIRQRRQGVSGHRLGPELQHFYRTGCAASAQWVQRGVRSGKRSVTMRLPQ